MQKSGLAHLCHHDKHWEYCYDYGERVRFIEANKHTDEVPTRLKWFAIVPDELLPCKDSIEWAACNKAWAAFDKADKARAAYTKASDACNKAWAAFDKDLVTYAKTSEAYDKAWNAYIKAWVAYVNKYSKELDALHEQLFLGCPWNGKTMFPTEEK